jgi:hypothetical protein
MDDSLDNLVRRRIRKRSSSTAGPDILPRTLSAAPRGRRSERGLCLPHGWLLGLLVPAGPDLVCDLFMLRDNAADLSDVLGGVPLDEFAVDGRPAHRCWLYLHQTRHHRQRPRNRRLERLAAALGWPRDRSADWVGPALITGRDLNWANGNVPSIVVAAALPD